MNQLSGSHRTTFIIHSIPQNPPKVMEDSRVAIKISGGK